jgi:hypothetical protein
MLTAQKENSPLETEHLREPLQTTRSFDRMITSIEGLRERVEGFTLEQVSEIDQRLQTMSLRLGELQRRLRALTEIKQRMSRLRKTVEQVEAESLEQNRLTTRVEPIAVHSIAQVGTLLKFRRVIRSIKEAKSVPGALASANTRATTPVVPKPAAIISESATNEQELAADLPAIEHALPERSARETSVATISEAADESEAVLHPAPAMDFELVLPKSVETLPEPPTNVQELAADLPAIDYDLRERLGSATPADVTSEDLEQTEAIVHPAPTEMDFEPNEPFSNEPTDTIFINDSTTSRQPREIIAEFADTRDESPPSHEAIFEEFKGTEDREVHLAFSETETLETTDQTHMAASEEADFDQRLLDDLIKDYGEFTILPSSTPRAEAKKQPRLEPTTATPQVNASVTVNLPTQPSLPSQRKDGELDRKLKKLIKDYGEYDLYSRQTPFNLKTGVIAAFLLLTLIFSGFYFFSSPKSAVPVSASSTSPSPSSSETASKKTGPTGETNSGETPSAPSISNVDRPKTVEAGVAHNHTDKASEKKTK